MTNRLRRADPVGRLLTDPEVATPAFVIDDAKLQVNLDFAKEKAARLGVTLRPHLKTHKSIEIARRQMLSPEGPATVSTLAEARYFAENGVKDLIYAVGIAPQKLADVAAIREAGCDLKIILDNVAAAKAVSAFCTKRGVTIPVLIEVDCDGHRSGVRPESELLIEIARALTDGAELAGVLTHAGASYDVENLAVIRRAAANERDGIVTAAQPSGRPFSSERTPFWEFFFRPLSGGIPPVGISTFSDIGKTRAMCRLSVALRRKPFADRRFGKCKSCNAQSGMAP